MRFGFILGIMENKIKDYYCIMGYMRNDIHESGQNERNHPPILPMCPKSPMYLHGTKYDFCGRNFPRGLVRIPHMNYSLNS